MMSKIDILPQQDHVWHKIHFGLYRGRTGSSRFL